MTTYSSISVFSDKILTTNVMNLKKTTTVVALIGWAENFISKKYPPLNSCLLDKIQLST